MGKLVILTGLRANNDLHIGNYLGAMLPMVDMAKTHAGKYRLNFFVPDLHSFTTPIDHSTLYEQTINNIRMYVAAGLPLDDTDIHIYRQSFVPAHSELAWILSCFTGFGEMSRMTQFKDKKTGLEKTNLKKGVFTDVPEGYKSGEASIEEAGRNVSVGLFNYPILMAADILLYGATYVPVGDDQTQHLEFTRDIAERMNNKFGDLFTLPLPVKKQHQFFGKDQGLRIRDLIDPTRKMSKSDETGKGVVFLNDSPETASKKIKSAATDSLGEVRYDYETRPGISNLLDILKLFGGDPDEFMGNSQYGPLKSKTAELVAGFVTDFQARLNQVDEQAIAKKLETSEAEMNTVANRQLLEVQQVVGLRNGR